MKKLALLIVAAYSALLWLVCCCQANVANIQNFVVTGTVQLAESPYIISNPQSQSNASTSNLTFWIQAGGTTPLTYQWYATNGILTGITTTNLTTNYTASTNGFYAVANNLFGSATSSTASGVWTNLAGGGGGGDGMPSNGLMAYWPLTNDWVDTVNANNLTTNVAGVSLSSAGGINSTKISGNGYLWTAHSATIEATNNYSWSIWFYPDAISNSASTAMLVEKNDAGGSQADATYRILIGRASSNATFRFTNSAVSSAASTLSDQSWNHIAAWKSASAGQTYIQLNGGAIVTNSLVSFTNYACPLYFGGKTNLTVSVAGYMAYARFYHTNLSTAEITTLYNSGVPK